MAGTKRTLAALDTLLASNSVGAIDAQDLRDFLWSVMPSNFTFDWPGTTTSTLNVRATGDTNAKSLWRFMPAGTGESSTTGDRTEITIMAQDIDQANRTWIDFKVRVRPGDSVPYFHILSDREGTQAPIARWVLEMDGENESAANAEQFSIVRDEWIDGVEAGGGAGTWMFRMVVNEGIRRIEQGTIQLVTGNLVIGSDSGDIVVHGTNTMRVWTDADQDLGAESFRWKNIYMRDYLEISESSDPAAAPANKVRLYSKDNGSGKTQLVARFPSGAVQVIATEP